MIPVNKTYKISIDFSSGVHQEVFIESDEETLDKFMENLNSVLGNKIVNISNTWVKTENIDFVRAEEIKE